MDKTIQMTALEMHFPEVLFIMLYKVILGTNYMANFSPC